MAARRLVNELMIDTFCAQKEVQRREMLTILAKNWIVELWN